MGWNNNSIRLFRYQASTSIASCNRVFLNHAEKLKNYCFKIFFYILSFIRFYIEIIDVYQILGVFSELNTYSDSFPKPIIHHSSTHQNISWNFLSELVSAATPKLCPANFFWCKPLDLETFCHHHFGVVFWFLNCS